MCFLCSYALSTPLVVANRKVVIRISFLSNTRRVSEAIQWTTLALISSWSAVVATTYNNETKLISLLSGAKV